ncbi:uncharacterized protein LOC124661710 [Lolium rigidum]|uniref:uncharacterized protein LOC124661710 n=1 Tax=Lolium rigidum TaxID=89674 RepID=UPI001F5CA900|nr:uncharacterized protein LOC124661710 [Lolium rigidum]
MEPLELEDNGDHQPSLESSLDSGVIYDDTPICPRIGSEYQAEISKLSTEGEHRRFIMTSSHESMVLDYDHPGMIGPDISIMWASSEVHNEEILRRQHSSESEARASSQDEDTKLTSISPIQKDTSDHDSTDQDSHSVVPVDQMESGSNLAHGENFDSSSTQEGLNFTNKPLTQQGEIKQFTPLPGLSSSLWSGIEAECFLLGLYIFGKNLSLMSRFVGNKTVGNVLLYYYGKFYGGDAYKRWSDCRKARTRRCILGERIFTGSRQQEIISRLKSVILKESHDSLLEIFKSFNNGQTSLEDLVFSIKSIVGTEAFVEAVGIGKGKHDLTGFVQDPSKPNQVLSIHPDIPTGKDCSLLASEDIIKFLTGGFRISKTRSNDLFWEAVWPRLIARGWRSEQPKDVGPTKNCIVFLVPGIKKFSRSKLTKGTHYFDSVSDVLKRVAANPVLLELEVGGTDNGVTAEQNGNSTDINLSQDAPLDGYQELPKFTVIDTTLVHGEEPFRVRELRKLPPHANVRFGPSHYSHNTVSFSSSEEQDEDDQSADDQEVCQRVTADVNGAEMVSVCNEGKENQVDLLQYMSTAPSFSYPVNGHSSNGSSNKIDLACFFGPKRKTERRKYLSPVSKHRRLSSCSNDQTRRRSFSFSNGDGLVREKIKPLSTSSKPTVVDIGGNIQTKSIATCSTKEKPYKQVTVASNSRTNGRSKEKKNVSNLNKDKSFECKGSAIPKVRSKIRTTKANFAQKGVQISSLVGQVKPETALDDKPSTKVCVASLDNHGHMKTEEALSVLNSDWVPDVSEATGGPTIPQRNLASLVNSRRHGTRNRAPTAKALEAVALGLLGGKRKDEPKSPGTSRPRKRAHKSWVYAPTNSDTDKSSMEVDAQL